MKPIFCFLLLLNLVTVSHAQRFDEEKLLKDNWSYTILSNGMEQQHLQQLYLLDFKEGGNGILTVRVVFISDGEPEIAYNGFAKFAYQLIENEEDQSTYIQINYDHFDLKLMPNWDRSSANVHDKLVIEKIKESISNKDVSYGIGLTGSYLVVEGFEQDDQNSFSYFTNNPVNLDGNF